MYSVGQKVVCVDDHFEDYQIKFVPERPVLDQVYTIREIDIGTTWGHIHATSVVLYLKGLNNPASDVPPYRERGFDAKRFWPLTEEEKQNTTKNKKTCHKKLEEAILSTT